MDGSSKSDKLDRLGELQARSRGKFTRDLVDDAIDFDPAQINASKSKTPTAIHGRGGKKGRT